MLPKFLILNYHRLIAPAACAHNLFDVGFDQFRLQLNRLKENNVNFVSLENPVMSQTQLNVAITFDDGTLSDLIYALPALKETG
ncbi:MAG TPA: hypothetical protein VD905_20200, partial [Flavobacteriales bacterium]|nr:hypothetical protein [Flavobacteriales bacterium]